MLFAVTWAADIGAFAGRQRSEGPKLWPRFSPNKTWSGFVGGLVGGRRRPAALLAALPRHAGLSLAAARARSAWRSASPPWPATSGNRRSSGGSA